MYRDELTLEITLSSDKRHANKLDSPLSIAEMHKEVQ